MRARQQRSTCNLVSKSRLQLRSYTHCIKSSTLETIKLIILITKTCAIIGSLFILYLIAGAYIMRVVDDYKHHHKSLLTLCFVYAMAFGFIVDVFILVYIMLHPTKDFKYYIKHTSLLTVGYRELKEKYLHSYTWQPIHKEVLAERKLMQACMECGGLNDYHHKSCRSY